VAVNCFDLEEKSPGLMEKKPKIRSLEFPRFWKKLLGLLRSDLDRVSSTVA
jgi:hypothetical protein